MQNKVLIDYIERLTNIWLLWMENHNKANDEKLTFNDRRKAGEQCEILQKERQEILQEIDEVFCK